MACNSHACGPQGGSITNNKCQPHGGPVTNNKCRPQGVTIPPRPRTVWQKTIAETVEISYTELQEIRTALNVEKSVRSLSSTYWSTLLERAEITTSEFSAIKNVIDECRSRDSDPAFSWILTAAVQNEINAYLVIEFRNFTNILQDKCICQCNYCTCNCNYCTCDCNYCTCQCQYCTCDCNYCTCQCQYCTCDCNFCTCQCQYCTCQCQYCTCDCQYSCTCQCDYRYSYSSCSTWG